LEKVRIRLLRPTVEALDRGAADLSAAVECLRQLETSLTQAGRVGARQALELEMANLRRELRCVQELVAGAGKFHAAWGRLMAAADEGTGNYTAGGDSAALQQVESGRVMLHG